jgi:NitT/TauT family transport system permease protein
MRKSKFMNFPNRPSSFFNINETPSKFSRWLYRISPFVGLLVLYEVGSTTYLTGNPEGKIFPSFFMMGQRVCEMIPEPLWKDTFASLSRFSGGIFLAALTGLLLGLNMGLFPRIRLLLLPLVTSLSNIPTLAVLPILLVIFGIGDFSKVVLIFLGVVFYISRDIYTTTVEIPRELLVKAQSLGASQLTLAYRIVLPMVMPRLIEAVRQALSPAWLFLIASEGIAASEGLGYRIFLVRRYLDMAAIIPYVAWITLLAFLMDRFLVRLLTMLYPWRQSAVQEMELAR